MRCFLAVETTSEVRQELGKRQRELSGKVPNIRWVRPEQMHLTLEFFGEVDESFPASVAGPLMAACIGHGVFEVRLVGLGAFPASHRARVLWVGVEAGREDLVEVQRSTGTALKSVGVQIEDRPYTPHLTFGRLRMPTDLSALVAREHTGVQAVSLAGSPFPVTRVVLIKSELRPEGPCYTELASYPLGPARYQGLRSTDHAFPGRHARA